MGLLETRSLHLENMIYLSAQEGVLPPSKYKSTLIPFTLRRGFGLPIGGTDDIGQDYTFFQSISRAKHLIFVVAPADAQRAGGEESRYINLLRYVYGVHIETQTLQLTSERQAFGAISKPKDEEVRRHLQEYLTPGGRALSPSSLITYLSCPLQSRVFGKSKIQQFSYRVTTSVPSCMTRCRQSMPSLAKVRSRRKCSLVSSMIEIRLAILSKLSIESSSS